MLCKKNNLTREYTGYHEFRTGFFGLVVVLSLAIFFSPATHLWPGESLSSILEQSPYTDEQNEDIHHLFKEADENGIPPDLILPRLEEGIAKKVRFHQLMVVLKKEIDCLLQARELLLAVDPSLVLSENPSLWLRTGILLVKQVPVETVRSIASASVSRWGDYRDATVLFLSLTEWGLTGEETITVIKLLLTSAIAGPDFIGVITLFTRGRSLHIPPEEIIARIKEVIDESSTIEELEEKILY